MSVLKINRTFFGISKEKTINAIDGRRSYSSIEMRYQTACKYWRDSIFIVLIYLGMRRQICLIWLAGWLIPNRRHTWSVSDDHFIFLKIYKKMVISEIVIIIASKTAPCTWPAKRKITHVNVINLPRKHGCPRNWFRISFNLLVKS